MTAELLTRLENHDAALAVIGLGYVGLPLAVAMAQRYRTVGFDINPQRIARLQAGHDDTCEVPDGELRAAAHLKYTADAGELADCQVFIITVPTPIDASKRPDLGPLLAASRTAGQALRPGAVVIYESTVYPGATQDDCVPVLERESGLVCDRDFVVGYSPERINPGDRERRLQHIVKVTSGSTPQAAEFVDRLYASIIPAGTFRADSIRVAEAAKVIENTQRDLNIALVNELAVLFNRMGIDTSAVLAAAGTKWNFLPFKPGLVGGHCIGVDPYYLTHKAQSIGHHPAVILAGRRVNDAMGTWVAGEILRLMAQRGVYQPGARVLILGLAFKENCPDLRNTRVVDVIGELRRFNLHIDVHDPWVDADAARHEYGLELVAEPQAGAYAAVVHAVSHHQFAERAASLRDSLCAKGVLYDVRATLPPELVDGRL